MLTLKQLVFNHFIVIILVGVITWYEIWNIKQKHLMTAAINDNTGNIHKVDHKRACKITIKF